MTDSAQADWRKVVEKHGRRVFRIALRILGSVHDAEDVAQEVFAEAYQLHRAGPVHSMTGLLVRLATLRAIDHRRRNRPVEELCDHDRVSPIEPYEEVAANELSEWLRAAMDRLPAQQAAVFSMVYFEEMSRDQVASNLDISPEAVSSALYKARQYLLSQLSVSNRGGLR